jgi:hypothetical protein
MDVVVAASIASPRPFRSITDVPRVRLSIHRPAPLDVAAGVATRFLVVTGRRLEPDGTDPKSARVACKPRAMVMRMEIPDRHANDVQELRNDHWSCEVVDTP